MSLYSAAELWQVLQNSGQTRTASINLSESSKSFSGTYDIFLSHSSLDAGTVAGLKQHIEETMGFSVYVYWINDPALTRAISKENARTIKSRMEVCTSLIYAFSENSYQSKWMPWELGYFDGKKNRVAILPITTEHNQLNSYHGQEYLGLYPYITKGLSSNNNKETLWVYENENTYINFRSWLSGIDPLKR